MAMLPALYVSEKSQLQYVHRLNSNNLLTAVHFIFVEKLYQNYRIKIKQLHHSVFLVILIFLTFLLI